MAEFLIKKKNGRIVYKMSEKWKGKDSLFKYVN